MRLTRTLRAAPFVVALFASASTANPKIVAPDSGVFPVFHLWITALGPEASVGGPTADIAYELPAVGASANVFVRSGPATAFCSLANSDQLTPDFLATAAIYWSAEVHLESYDRAGATFDLRWRRIVLDSAAADVGPYEAHTRLTLTPGPEQVFDLVRPRTADPNCGGLSVGLSMSFKENEALASSLLEYDVWLVDRDRLGRERVDHMTPRGLQGREIEYAFRPSRYSTDGLATEGGEVKVTIDGRITGRVRPDGRIDLVIRAARWFLKGSYGNGDGGSKQATIDDGDTIELELPAGDLAPGDRPPLAVAGERTSLLVTARRVS